MLTPNQIVRLNTLTSSTDHYNLDDEFYLSCTDWADSFNRNGCFCEDLQYNNRRDIFHNKVVISFSRYRDWIMSTNNIRGW